MSNYRPSPCSPGDCYGRYTLVRELSDRSLSRGRLWLCRCDCGAEKAVRQSSLRAGIIKSCGCFHRDEIAGRVTTHGQTGSVEYKAWLNMLSRCYNPRVPKFENHGGRGVSVHPTWRESFEPFLAYMGRRPSPRHTVERIDNNGNYEPGNTCWATYGEQNRNLRTTHLITFRGETLCLTDWAARMNMKGRTLSSRLFDYHWSEEEALTKPVKPRRSKSCV